MNQTVVVFCVALAIGLGFGLERERSQAPDGAEASAGLRTFAIASVCGALGAFLPIAGLLPAVLLAVAALAAMGYRHIAASDPGLTTEIALLCTVLLGALAVSQPALAAGIATVLVILLHGKATLHRLVRNALTRQEVSDALTLAAAALVIWPLLPDRYMGPFDAWNPRTLWLVAVLVMLVGAGGHIATRLFGEQAGLPLTGLFGGFISSVATIGSMAAMVRKARGTHEAAVASASLSSVATFVQMLLLLAATSAAAFRELALPLTAGLATMLLYAGAWLWRSAREPAAQNGTQPAGRSMDWRVAAGFVLLMALLLLANAAARAWAGSGRCGGRRICRRARRDGIGRGASSSRATVPRGCGLAGAGGTFLQHHDQDRGGRGRWTRLRVSRGQRACAGRRRDLVHCPDGYLLGLMPEVCAKRRRCPCPGQCGSRHASGQSPSMAMATTSPCAPYTRVMSARMR
ncbi:MgtC/SapB family protein [Cupriavidus sp. 8B]